MSGRNSTLVTYPRSSISPELWIPYVMIGVSCVTFLAVHFWCYHKRNRERYLRKRDEKRVKSGLIERRRITTLMVARYQSELGVNQSDTNTDLTQDALFYDNCGDVLHNENESENQGLSIQKSYTYQLLNENFKPEPAGAAAGLSGALPKQPGNGAKTIAASRTWPLVSERKCVSHNKHTGIPRRVVDTESTDNSQKTNYEIDYNFRNDSHPRLKSDQGRECVNPEKAIKESMKEAYDLKKEKTERVWDSFRGTSTESDSSSQGGSSQFLPTKSHISSAHVHRGPPPSYPNVFYTKLNSPYAIKSPLSSDFKPNQTKRRHDGAPVPYGAIYQGSFQDYSIANQTGDTEMSFNESDTGYCSPHPFLGIITSKEKEEVSTSISGDENAKSAHGTRSKRNEEDDGYQYGGNGTDGAKLSTIYSPLDKSLIQDSPFNTSEKDNIKYQQYSEHNSEKNNDQYSKSPNHSIDAVNNGRQQIFVRPENVQHHENSPNSVANTGRKVHASDTHSPDIKYPQAQTDSCPNKGHSVQQNVVIALHERPRPGLISRNPEKFRGVLQGNEMTKSWFSRSRFGTLNRVDTFDHSDNIARHDTPTVKDKTASSVPSQQLPLSHGPIVPGTDTGGLPSEEEVGEHPNTNPPVPSEARDDSKNSPMKKPVDGAISYPQLQTLPLRGLDPNIVFQHSKRKSGMKSE